MVVRSKLPTHSDALLRDVLSGLPAATGYRVTVKPLRYRIAPHLQAFTSWDVPEIVLQVPEGPTTRSERKRTTRVVGRVRRAHCREPGTGPAALGVASGAVPARSREALRVWRSECAGSSRSPRGYGVSPKRSAPRSLG